jgi:hypothetical protein
MVNIAVVSSIYGGFDDYPDPPPQTIPCDWIMVTDDPRYPPPPWRHVYEPRPHLRPSFASKVARARPDLYTGADVLIWMDGNVVIHDPTFISWALDLLGDASLAALSTQHARTGMRDEADVASRIPKYDGQPVKRQAEHYIAEGFPDGWGRWWTGVMVRTRDCPDFGSLWLTEMARWSCECQVSLPYVLWKMGLRPAGGEAGPACISTRPHLR